MPFDLTLTTPEGVRLQAEAEFVLAPGSEGDLGVLPGHSPLLSPLAIGHVVVTTSGGRERLAISGGFVEIHPDNVLILAETAEPVESIDVERAQAAKERAERRLEERAADLDIARAEAALARALNRIELTTDAS